MKLPFENGRELALSQVNADEYFLKKSDLLPKNE